MSLTANIGKRLYHTPLKHIKWDRKTKIGAEFVSCGEMFFQIFQQKVADSKNIRIFAVLKPTWCP